MTTERVHPCLRSSAEDDGPKLIDEHFRRRHAEWPADGLDADEPPTVPELDGEVLLDGDGKLIPRRPR